MGTVIPSKALLGVLPRKEDRVCSDSDTCLSSFVVIL